MRLARGLLSAARSCPQVLAPRYRLQPPVRARLRTHARATRCRPTAAMGLPTEADGWIGTDLRDGAAPMGGDKERGEKEEGEGEEEIIINVS